MAMRCRGAVPRAAPPSEDKGSSREVGEEAEGPGGVEGKRWGRAVGRSVGGDDAVCGSDSRAAARQWRAGGQSVGSSRV